MTKVSVIVPVYNVYNYLDKCLNSLANQTIDDIEVIIVNDGSKDNSQEIIDKYTNKYSNFRSYTKENGGLSDARNFGLKKAKGDYIAFLDSDDYVSLEMYEKMYNKAISDDFDLVVCDINYVYSKKIVKVSSNISKDTNDIKKVMLNFYPAAWNKLYKKSLFNCGIKFKKGVWFEDVEFIYRLIPYIKSVGTIKEPLIQYVQRDGSITNTINKKLYDYIDNWNGIIEFYKKNKFFDYYKKELEYSYVRYMYATFIKQASKYNKNDFLEAVKTSIENVQNLFPDYHKNSFFYKSLKGIYLLFFNDKLARIMYKFY